MAVRVVERLAGLVELAVHPLAAPRKPASALEAVGEAQASAGRLGAVAAHALADGQVTGPEEAAVDRAADAAVAGVGRARAAVHAVAGRGP